MIKTRNNNDDANFDENCEFRNSLSKIIKRKKLRYVVDVHGLSKNRPFDINLGINFGQNINSNERIFFDLQDMLETAGFKVSVDSPFCAGPKTIAGYTHKQFNIWTIQIEINCSITNENKNFEKCNLLLTIISNWLNKLKDV